MGCENSSRQGALDFDAVAIQIAPSILAADYADLRGAAASVGSADWLHVDVMDNHFVPNLTLGAPVVEALAAAADQPLDCHLMIEDPDRWAPGYAEAGAASVTFHAEAVRAPYRLSRELRGLGARAGLALRPATAVEPYEDLLPELDMLLVMTVEPGFGGQEFLAACLPKIKRARELLDKHGGDVWLQVDGGVSADTIERCADAGADMFVAGSAVFGADEPDRAVDGLRRQAEAAWHTRR
ncbi:MAG: ribulose-phosphate 3-epimerase [Nocardioidaceae bacterium]|nr:ribulose-phosphate 3-epimerase [Nocardioidaceae bacterium]